MKTIALLFLSGLPLLAQEVAVWVYGPNPDGVATNYPVSWVGWTNAPPGPAGSLLMSVEGARALKAATQASYDRYVSNQNWQVENVLTNRSGQFQAIGHRLEDWAGYLGGPQSAGSNFVSIAQASQWAREMVWLQQRVLRMLAGQYRPEDDDP